MKPKKRHTIKAFAHKDTPLDRLFRWRKYRGFRNDNELVSSVHVGMLKKEFAKPVKRITIVITED